VTEEAPIREVPEAPAAVKEPPRPRAALGRIWRDERGTAVVEFAIIALPLCLIVFGILDFGRALNYYNNMTQLAGQGARAATVNQNPNGGAATPIGGGTPSFQQVLACDGASGELRKGVTVNVASVPANVGDPVTITASYQFHFLPLLKIGTITLSATSTQRNEWTSTPTYSAGSATCPNP
jgi:Flp pilus assembly protein TadG